VLPLLVQVTNKESGAQIEAGFKRSPVRIGRNTLNDLAIDEGFISQWHGLVRFDEETTQFLDLGSTNGTDLNGQRLDKNVEVEVTPETKLQIGPLRFTFLRMALREDQVLSRRASAFALGGTKRVAKRVAEGGTVELGGEVSADQIADTISKASGGIASKKELMQMAMRQRDLMNRLKPLYEAFVTAQDALEEALREGLVDASEVEKTTRANLLETQFPRAFTTAAIRTEAGLEQTGEDVPGWMERLAPGSSGEWDNPLGAMERAGAVVETFAAALIDLEAGQKQIRKDLNIEPPDQTNALPKFNDSRELLAYLLDGNVDGRERMQELTRSFADIAHHQIGIISGVNDGARAILSAISPHAIGASAAGAIAKTSFGVGDFIWPFTAAGNYYKFAAKHFELSTGERFVNHLFGPAFARAYYRISGRRS